MLRYKMPAKEATSDKSPKFVSLPRPDISNIKTPPNRKQRKASKKLEKQKKADTETRKQVKDTQKWKYICCCRDPDCGIGPMNVRVRCN